MTALLVATAGPLEKPAHAQNQTQNRIDFQQIRNSVGAGERRAVAGGGGGMKIASVTAAAAEKAPDFLSLEIRAPFLFNTNAEQSPTGGTNSFETTPNVHVDLHKAIPTLQLFVQAGVDASSDRFTSTSAPNIDSVVGNVLLQYQSYDSKGKMDDQEFKPFFRYGPQWGYTPFFATRTSAVHDLAIGFDKGYAFDENFNRLPAAAHAMDNAIWGFSFEAFAARRISETDPSSYKLHASPSVTYAWTAVKNTDATDPQWSATLALDVDRQTFDGSGQENWTLTPVFNVEYDPPARWFGDKRGDNDTPRYAAYGRPRLIFQAANNWIGSNVVGIGSSQCTFGPVVRAGWKF